MNQVNVAKLIASDNTDDEFAEDVVVGLSQRKKSLSSKYLYDARGSDLFDQITELPEYYLYRAEKRILQTQAQSFFADLDTAHFDMIELGSGNGEKSRLLLDTIIDAGQTPDYYHIDISETAVSGLSETLAKEFPTVPIQGIHADYHERLANLKHIGNHATKAVLFLGSNIGNYNAQDSNELLKNIHKGLNSGDRLLIGFDLVKSYQRMIDAYNDSKGVTAAFNLNILSRMNRELGSDFNLNDFYHYEIYNPLEQAMQSFLVSTAEQTVTFEKIDFTVSFEQHEAFYLESSRKYTLPDIHSLAKQSGFEVINNFYDDNREFTDSLWRRL